MGDLRYLTAVIFFSWISISAQTPKKQFNESDFDLIFYSQFETSKIIPNNIKPQVLIALSFYPELKDVDITFRFRKRVTPLASRPKILSTFKRKGKRAYVITISTKSNERLTPILFCNLPFNAQIGVLGHELGHITEYKNKNSIQLLSIAISLLNSKYTNHFEFNTDLICINHGLGFQLYDWSRYVRRTLKIMEWKGASNLSNNEEDSFNQRYMNPQTIKKNIGLNILYKDNLPL